MSTTQFHSLLLDLAPADSGSSVPTRIQLLPPSGFAGRDGRGPFTYSFNDLLDAFNAYTDLPTTIETAGAAPAAFVVYEAQLGEKVTFPLRR